MKFIAVVDYNMGNLHSVSKALELASRGLGIKLLVSRDREDILRSSAIVLPGVGAFGKGIENLKRLNLIDALKERIRAGVPFLGICLGLQLLFTESEEHGKFKGLDIIKGRVVKFPETVKIPHMGWNQIQIKDKILNIKNDPEKFAESLEEKSKIGLFDGISDNSYFYFVHSYYVEPEDEGCIMAISDYGLEFTSVIGKDNIYGMQFHPEKSVGLGIKIFSNFAKIVSGRL
ncbi:MAG: imidazole glycerol phosphate synthase subunit HisH [Candidatus Omnitrophica bacterium]|nr:imidazole glycerol phosphate synthase subunit HisH [Candidatus Omnitrophota bacterium]